MKDSSLETLDLVEKVGRDKHYNLTAVLSGEEECFCN
jgi:hypothetical protein